MKGLKRAESRVGEKKNITKRYFLDWVSLLDEILQSLCALISPAFLRLKEPQWILKSWTENWEARILETQSRKHVMFCFRCASRDRQKTLKKIAILPIDQITGYKTALLKVYSLEY